MKGCFVCNKKTHFVCGGCHSFAYCQTTCATQHWITEHNTQCIGVQVKRKRNSLWLVCDEGSVEITREAALKSVTLANVLKDVPSTEMIQMPPNVSLETLQQVVELLEGNTIESATFQQAYNVLILLNWLDASDTARDFLANAQASLAEYWLVSPDLPYNRELFFFESSFWSEIQLYNVLRAAKNAIDADKRDLLYTWIKQTNLITKTMIITSDEQIGGLRRDGVWDLLEHLTIDFSPDSIRVKTMIPLPNGLKTLEPEAANKMLFLATTYVEKNENPDNGIWDTWFLYNPGGDTMQLLTGEDIADAAIDIIDEWTQDQLAELSGDADEYELFAENRTIFLDNYALPIDFMEMVEAYQAGNFSQADQLLQENDWTPNWWENKQQT